MKQLDKPKSLNTGCRNTIATAAESSNASLRRAEPNREVPCRPGNDTTAMRNHQYDMSTGGITKSEEFAKKKLAAFAVNVGLRCGHDCTYCSARASLRCHEAFPELGEPPFGVGYSIVDPNIVEKVARDAARTKKRGLVQICTTVDAWAPEAQALDLGRRCLEAVLEQPGWTVRVLTKNAAVAEDFELIRKYKDRVLIGLSLTGTRDKQDALSVIETHASSISERMAALRKAHNMGLRTFGMLCPLLPAIADAPEQVDELVQFVKACGAEEVFCEPANARGNSLTLTEEKLQTAGFAPEAEAISRIRNEKVWSGYTVRLVQHVQASMLRHMTTDRLRFLLYPKKLTKEDEAQIRTADAGVVWL